MNNKITYSELQDRIAEGSGLSKQATHEFMYELTALIEEGLLRDKHVRIKGLGSFNLRHVSDRQGINPRTGEPIEIPEHDKVVFKPDNKLDRSIRRSTQSKKEEKNLNKMPKKEYRPMDYSELSKEKQPIYKNLYAQIGTAAVIVLVILIAVFWPSGEPAAEMTDYPETVQAEPASEVTPAPAQEERAALVSEEKVEAEEVITKEEVIPPQKEKPKPAKIHSVQKGESLWVLAKKYYGDPYLWPLIYQENQEKIKNPDVLRPGKEIVIPNLVGQVENLAQEDKVKLADGNIRAYEVYKTLNKTGSIDYLKVALQLNPGLANEYQAELVAGDMVSRN